MKGWKCSCSNASGLNCCLHAVSTLSTPPAPPLVPPNDSLVGEVEGMARFASVEVFSVLALALHITSARQRLWTPTHIWVRFQLARCACVTPARLRNFSPLAGVWSFSRRVDTGKTNKTNPNQKKRKKWGKRHSRRSGMKLKRKTTMPVSSTIISTRDVSRTARHAGRPVILNRAPLRPPSPLRPLPLSRGGLGSPTSRERSSDLSDDLWPQRRWPRDGLRSRRNRGHSSQWLFESKDLQWEWGVLLLVKLLIDQIFFQSFFHIQTSFNTH